MIRHIPHSLDGVWRGGVGRFGEAIEGVLAQFEEVVNMIGRLPIQPSEKARIWKRPHSPTRRTSLSRRPSTPKSAKALT